MSATGLLSRVDDWINPIVVKELRQAVKSRMVVSILMIFLGVQLFLLGVILLMRELGEGGGPDIWNAGKLVFHWQQGILLWTLMLLVPAYAAIRLAAERSDHNVDLLFISTLKPRSIISGKFFAALVLAMMVFSTCAPFMTFTYLLRGLDIPTILTVLGIDLLGMLLASMIALFVAAVPGPRPLKFVLAVLAFLGLAFLCSIFTGVTMELIARGMVYFEGRVRAWLALGLLVTAVLGMVGVFYVYAVALVSPPSSNRMLPVRVFLAVCWALLGAGAYLTGFYADTVVHLDPVSYWVLGSCLLLSVQLCVSICERERWGPRVARSVPRRPELRLPAWLFYTGAAGGVTFTTLLAAATLGGAYTWVEGQARLSSLPPGEGERARALIESMTVLYLYCYCYGLSAVLVRTHALAGQLRPAFTWLVALLLVGLASSVPAVIAYIAFSEQMRMNTDGGWWKLPNPFLGVYEISASSTWGGGNRDFRELCYWFLCSWAVLVTALAMPWYVAQLHRFHPPARRKRPPEADSAEVVVVDEAPAAARPSSVEAG
jgi:hypothetical protein